MRSTRALAAIGEQKEKLFAMRMPDRTGMFYDMYKAVQPRLVTEFVYRHSPNHSDALVYMAVESAEVSPLPPDPTTPSHPPPRLAALTHPIHARHPIHAWLPSPTPHPRPPQVDEGAAKFSADVVDSLGKLGVYALDVTGDEMAKGHARHLAGGRPGDLPGERIIRFEFPENAGALHQFLKSLRKDWFVTMLHYRNHGGQVGKVLAGVRVPEEDDAAFTETLESLGYIFFDETDNIIYKDFMR